MRSQVDLYLIHRLLTQEDIEISRANLLAVYPREVMDGSRELVTEGETLLGPGAVSVDYAGRA